MGDMLDHVSKGMAKATSRRQALKVLGAGLATTAVGSAFASSAIAAPQTCLTCACGVGKPCNTKSTVCTTQKSFPTPEAACGAACTQAGFKFCGGVTQFHCPHGCP
jgi:hypothetical protein